MQVEAARLATDFDCSALSTKPLGGLQYQRQRIADH